MSKKSRTSFKIKDASSLNTPEIRSKSTAIFGRSVVAALKALVNPDTSTEEREKLCQEIGQAGHIGRLAQTVMPTAAQQLTDYAKGVTAYNRAILDVTKASADTTVAVTGYQSESAMAEQKFKNLLEEQEIKQTSAMEAESVRHQYSKERLTIDAWITSQQQDINHEYGLNNKLGSIKLRELQEERDYHDRVNSQLLLNGGTGKEFIAKKEKLSVEMNNQANPITELGRSLMNLIGL